jgi:3-hydroxybutyrate dehydrogenase
VSASARPERPLAERHAVVTGANRGIGAAIATALVEAGASVSLFGRDESSLLEMVQRLGAAHAVAAVADVTQPAAVRTAFGAARARFGPVHMLINNAGQAVSAKFTDTDEALWERLMSVNLTGAYRCTREAVPDMLRLKFGRIVNVASIAGLRGAPYISAYAASKHGMIGLTRSLALEFATKGITVNAVCPGYTDTDLVREAIDRIVKTTGRRAEEVRATLAGVNPQERMIEPDEVAHSVLWLCCPGTEGINGQSIVIAGGEVS